jgi:hypothetical protein
VTQVSATDMFNRAMGEEIRRLAGVEEVAAVKSS